MNSSTDKMTVVFEIKLWIHTSRELAESPVLTLTTRPSENTNWSYDHVSLRLSLFIQEKAFQCQSVAEPSHCKKNYKILPTAAHEQCFSN